MGRLDQYVVQLVLLGIRPGGCSLFFASGFTVKFVVTVPQSVAGEEP
jgi:hypothetical protein